MRHAARGHCLLNSNSNSNKQTQQLSIKPMHGKLAKLIDTCDAQQRVGGRGSWAVSPKQTEAK